MKLLKRIAKASAALAVAAAVLVSTAVPTFAAAKHTVTFMYGTKVAKVVVDDGCNAIPPSDTYIPGYNFMGWVGNTNNVKSDLIIMGAYDKVATQPAPQPVPQQNNCGKTYQVRFVDSLTGGEYYKQTVSDGANANPPEVPFHPGYHFDGYTDSYENVHSDRTIYTKYGWDYGEVITNPEIDQWWLVRDGDGDTEDVYIPLWWLL